MQCATPPWRRPSLQPINGCHPVQTSVSHHHFFHLSTPNNHQPLKHELEMCVCRVWEAWGRSVGGSRAATWWFRKTGGEQESSGAHCTWPVKTQRHAKRQKYCNEKELSVEIVSEGLIIVGFSAGKQKQEHHVLVVSVLRHNRKNSGLWKSQAVVGKSWCWGSSLSGINEV